MIPAAVGLMSSDRSEESLLDLLFEQLTSRLGPICCRTEWRGFATVVPQIGIDLAPVGATVQLDSANSSYEWDVAQVVEGLAGARREAAAAALLGCNCRLDVMAATPRWPVVDGRELRIVAQTDLDPSLDEVAAFLALLGEVANAVIHDCVNNRVLLPRGREWWPLRSAT